MERNRVKNGRRIRATDRIVAFMSFCLIALFLIGQVRAEDMIRVRRIDESRIVSEETLAGKIDGVTTTEVTLSQTGTPLVVPGNTIIWVQYQNEPIDLTTARTHYRTSNYADALAQLAKISDTDFKALSEPIQAEVDFLRAASLTQSAQSGSDRDALTAAGRALTGFLKSHETSWHVFEVYELTGDILIALGRNDQAKNYFERLATAPWSDVKLRGMTSAAEILLVSEKWEEAAVAFQAVIDFAQENSPWVNEEKDYARIGLARALAGQQKNEEALKLLQSVVDDNPLRNVHLAAKLYNTMGDIDQSAGRNQDALLAYLHVDLLYSESSQEHCKALRELYRLWTAKGRQDRAAEALRTLQERYKTNL